MSMNGRKKIQSIQKEFTEKFSHLTIIFLDEDNIELDNTKSLSEVRKKKGEDVSTREIKKIVEQLIKKEDKRKPLTDDKLALILKEKGYPIARRTVAKYREQLELPVARLRKEI